MSRPAALTQISAGQYGIGMAARKIIAGLIGAGRMGKMHAENILFHLPDVFLKAIAEHNMDENWSRSLDIPVYSRDENSVLDDPEIEAVIIAASSTSHVALIKAAARAGKQIFCEKPMAFEPEALKEAIEAAEQAQVKLQVGFNRRFDPDIIRLREIVQSGKIGSPYIIRKTNRDPVRPTLAFARKSGGIFLDFCIHDFDMIRYVTGTEVAEVYAAGAVLIEPQLEQLGDLDTALISIRLLSGALCIIDVSRETHYGYDQQV